jgi:Fic family protein
LKTKDDFLNYFGNVSIKFDFFDTYCRSNELISLIFKLPYCRISNVTEAGIAQRQTASTYLKQLVEAGVLAEVESGKEKLFVHPKLYDLLTTENNNFKKYEF